MRILKIVTPVYVAISFSILMASDTVNAQDDLGQFPLCEASAALLIPCPDRQGEECLLVGDNEQGQELYLFSVKENKLDAKDQRAFDLHLDKKQEIADIEAFAGISADEILAIGSHSRDNACVIKKKRNRFGKVILPTSVTTSVDALNSRDIDCKQFFDKPVLDPSMQLACEAIVAAEKKAAEIATNLEGKKIPQKIARTLCNSVNAFNAEGAVALKSGTGTDVWIGLRSPLLAAHPAQPEKKNLAILLRLRDLTEYTFDQVAFIDLDGRGIRDMAADGDSIWIIAGPAADGSEPFQLRRISKSALDHTKTIDSQLINKALPNSSEGLAVAGKTAYVVIDGDDKGVGKQCKENAKYQILTLP